MQAEPIVVTGARTEERASETTVATEVITREDLEATGAGLVATGNIGCIEQIASAAKLPVVHTVELLDWAYGGKRPKGVGETGRAA